MPATGKPVCVTVIVLVEVAGFVSNAATAPVGKPVAASVTLPVKSLTGLIVIVTVPWSMRKTSSLLVDADSVKFGGGVTVKLIVVV